MTNIYPAVGACLYASNIGMSGVRIKMSLRRVINFQSTSYRVSIIGKVNLRILSLNDTNLFN